MMQGVLYFNLGLWLMLLLSFVAAFDEPYSASGFYSGL